MPKIVVVGSGMFAMVSAKLLVILLVLFSRQIGLAANERCLARKVWYSVHTYVVRNWYEYSVCWQIRKMEKSSPC